MSRFLSILDRLLLLTNLLIVASGSIALFLELGAPALGALLLCWLVARPVARLLRSRPFPVYESTPGYTVAGGLQILALLGLPGGSLARHLALIFASLLIVLVLWPKGPSDRLKRLLKKLTPKLRRFGRPVMGGAT